MMYHMVFASGGSFGPGRSWAVSVSAGEWNPVCSRGGAQMFLAKGVIAEVTRASPVLSLSNLGQACPPPSPPQLAILSATLPCLRQWTRCLISLFPLACGCSF